MRQDVLTIQLILVKTGRHWFDRLAKKKIADLQKSTISQKVAKKFEATVMSCGFHKKIAKKFQG